MAFETYDPARSEAKWQDIWEKNRINQTDLARAANPYYVLMMFPYPSAEGLHVGNVYAFTGADIQGRYRRLHGSDVFEPIGFDAFGIHSENYALRINTHPAKLIPRNVANFRRQLHMMGLMLDWSHEVLTADPRYYKWTQWIFLQLYKQGLAYRGKAPVNWCPRCHTVIADEQVISGECERHPGTAVERRELEQWFFRITHYAQRLLDNLSWIDWSESTKTAQRNWIGRSEGAMVSFELQGRADALTVYTTRPDTLYGATYMVMAPEHPLVEQLVSAGQCAAVQTYVAAARHMQISDRADTAREKTGVALGANAINPVNGKPIPIWVSDYVLAGYGTGAIMAVPAHDQRDYEFAVKFGLPIIPVIRPVTGEAPAGEAYVGEGVMVNSGPYDGMASQECLRTITADLEKRNVGKATVQYRLRDWCISRQRYWGPPIPMIHCERCGIVPVPEDQLPVLLPEIEDFRPDTPGGKPLERHRPFYETTCPACGGPAHRDADVSDNFLDSAWYFLRYPSSERDDVSWDQELTRKWLPVNMYVGGNEHAVLHLMYTRFLCMAFKDMGLIDFEEPFKKFRAHGLLIREGGKMSKTHGNVITPDVYVEQYGADTLRMYLMFIGPYSEGGDFRDSGIIGVRRFLERAHRLYGEYKSGQLSRQMAIKLHQTIRKVGEDIEAFSYNTAIAALMELLNEMRATEALDRFALESFALLLAPFAPHEAEELWAALGHSETILKASWPEYDPALTVTDQVDVAVQVLGRLRGTIRVPRGASAESVRSAAEAEESVARHLAGRRIVRVVHVPDRLVNFVVQ